MLNALWVLDSWPIRLLVPWVPDTAKLLIDRLLFALDSADTEVVERPAHATAVSVASATESLGDLMRSGNTTYNQC